MFSNESSPTKILRDWLEYETGHAWCESAYKYQTNPYIAEFANTVTNLPIILLPLLNAVLLQKYTSKVNSYILIPNMLMTVNGLASAYYHATINLIGQLVDELSILWILNTFLIVYVPIMKWYPEEYRSKMTAFRLLTFLTASVISLMCFIEPNLNAPALMFYSIPGIAVINYEGKHSGIPEIAGFPRRVLIFWSLAAGFWVADRVMCDVWLYLEIPYLHAVFHLLSSVAAYTVFVMFSLIDIESRSTEHKFSVAIRYFPDKGGSLWSLPYLSVIEKATSE